MTRKEIEEIIFNIECDLITLILAVLKLIGILNWAWFWILFPIWILIIIKILNNNKK